LTSFIIIKIIIINSFIFFNNYMFVFFLLLFKLNLGLFINKFFFFSFYFFLWISFFLTSIISIQNWLLLFSALFIWHIFEKSNQMNNHSNYCSPNSMLKLIHLILIFFKISIKNFLLPHFHQNIVKYQITIWCAKIITNIALDIFLSANTFIGSPTTFSS